LRFQPNPVVSTLASILVLLTSGCAPDLVTFRFDEAPRYPHRCHATVKWQGSAERTARRVIDGGFLEYMFRWLTDVDVPERREHLGRHETRALKDLERLLQESRTKRALVDQIQRDNPDLGGVLDEAGRVEVELTGTVGLTYFMLIEQSAETYRYGPISVANDRGQSIEILYVMLEWGVDFPHYTVAEEAYGFWVDMAGVITSDRTGLVVVNMRRILFDLKRKLERDDITEQQAIDEVVKRLMSNLQHELDHIFSPASFSDEMYDRLAADLRRIDAPEIDRLLQTAVLGELRTFAYQATREPWGMWMLGNIFSGAVGSRDGKGPKLRLPLEVIVHRLLDSLGYREDVSEWGHEEVEAFLASRNPSELRGALEALLTDPRDGYGFYEALPDYGFDTDPPDQVLLDALGFLGIDPGSVEIRYAPVEQNR
jgi:hypothetical protein